MPARYIGEGCGIVGGAAMLSSSNGTHASSAGIDTHTHHNTHTSTYTMQAHSIHTATHLDIV